MTDPRPAAPVPPPAGHPAAAPVALAYAPARGRRRRLRRLAAVLLLSACAAVGWRWGPPYYRQAQYLAWQRRCMAYTRPADMVVYEDGGPRADALLDRPDYGWTYFGPSTHPPPPNVGHMPPAWAEHKDGWAPAWPGIALPPRETVFFLHARRSPAGRERLVVVRGGYVFMFSGGGVWLGGSSYDLATWRPGSTLHPARPPTGLWEASLCLCAGTTRRLYAGQPNPADRSRFTIVYEEDGRRGTIEGRLNDDDTVSLAVRDGTAGG